MTILKTAQQLTAKAKATGRITVNELAFIELAESIYGDDVWQQ